MPSIDQYGLTPSVFPGFRISVCRYFPLLPRRGIGLLHIILHIRALNGIRTLDANFWRERKVHALGHRVLRVDHKTRRDTRWRSWLRHCATSPKVAGSIPYVFIGIFHWHNPSGRTMALGLTQPVTEVSTGNISWGKGGRCIGLTNLPRSCPDCPEIWEPQPPGTIRACNWFAL